MPKRFRDTNLSREAWYRKLSPVFKCAWDFLCDECDNAGMWTIDVDAMEFYIGDKVDIAAFITAINTEKIRLEMYGDSKIFITGFIEFQYGELSEKCIPHKKIISLLKKYNLFERVCIPYTKGTSTLKEEEEEKEEEEDKEMEKEEIGAKQKKHRKVNIHQVDTRKQLGDYFKTVIPELEKFVEINDKRKLLGNFITESRPQIIEPYMDLWNLTVLQYNLSQVETISETRLKKFTVRIREQSFDFIKVLTEIKKSHYLQGKTTDWKVDWDWIFENDSNYIKIIEGKYKNPGLN